MTPTNESIGRAFRESITVGFDRHVDAKVWIINRARELDRQAPGEWVMAPNYRGYANLGIGAYMLDHSAEDQDAELVISIATEEEKEGRTVGDLRSDRPSGAIPPEKMAVRLRFDNVAGLDALEQQLKLLREVHFPAPQPPAQEQGDEVFGWWMECHGTDADFGQFVRDPSFLENMRSHGIVKAATPLYTRAAGAEDAQDAARLDWLAHHGAALRNDPPLDGGGWFVLAPYHTEIPSVDGRIRFKTSREAIDAAIASQAQEGES